MASNDSPSLMDEDANSTTADEGDQFHTVAFGQFRCLVLAARYDRFVDLNSHYGIMEA